MNTRFKKIREEAKLTQKEFAEKLNLKIFQVKDIESGKQKVTPELALLTKEIFEISPNWLVFNEGSMYVIHPYVKYLYEKEFLNKITSCSYDIVESLLFSDEDTFNNTIIHILKNDNQDFINKTCEIRSNVKPLVEITNQYIGFSHHLQMTAKVAINDLSEETSNYKKYLQARDSLNECKKQMTNLVYFYLGEKINRVTTIF